MYCRHLIFAVALVASAAAAPVKDGSSLQVHIAQGPAGDSGATTMTVSYVTPSATPSVVYVGTPSNPDPSSFTPVTNSDPPTVYNFVSKYSPDSPYKSGYIHHVLLAGLKPLTTYLYACDQRTSQVFNFTTGPAVSPDAHYVFGMIGDLGQTENSTNTMHNLLADTSIGMTILIGDLSYADSAGDPASKPCTQTRWDSWSELVEPLAATRPMMVLPGNHEVEQEGPPPATQEQFLAYRSRFKMPYEDSLAQNGSLYYSFNVGSVHWIMLNSYMDFNVSSVQYDWLVKDLAGIDRTVTPWIVACMHAPWYNSNSHHHNEFEEVYMRTDMEPLLYKAGVDLVFSGHVHAYERMYPVYNNDTTTGAPLYINIGDGGNREGAATGYLDPVPTWSAYREAAFGHGRLEVFNSTHMQWSWHKTLLPESTTSDVAWIVKNTHLGLYHKGSSAFGIRPSPM